MIRLPTLAMLGLTAAACGVLFSISHDVQSLEGQLGTLNRQIREEQNSIRVLRAEWAYLNQPSRLRALAAQYSALEPMAQSQILAGLDELPMPLPGSPEMPGYPVPRRRPDMSVEGPAIAMLPAAPPAILDEETSPIIVAAGGVAGGPAPTVLQAAMLPTAGLVDEGAVDMLLATFRQQLSGQETAP